jgi:hypothetical protein
MEQKKVWYYLPDRKWFSNRKEVKDYLGGTYPFSQALKKRDVVFIPQDK